MIEIENKDTLLKLLKKLKKLTAMNQLRITTLLIYTGAKKALKDPTILTTANTEFLNEISKQ